MSQINCLPRPAFWKVPEYVNTLDGNESVYDEQVQQYLSSAPRKSSLTLHRDSRAQHEKIKKRVRFKDVDGSEYQTRHHQPDEPIRQQYQKHSTRNNVRFLFISYLLLKTQ